MTIGRIPGPLGDAVSTKVVQSHTALGAAPAQTKLVPKGVDARILFPPPRLCQMEIYKGTEGMFGCWATVAEMIVRRRNPNARFARPEFEKLLHDTTPEGKVRYMDFVEAKLESFGFVPVAGGMSFDWEISTVASSVADFGPLLCSGRFFDGSGASLALGGEMHCIAVFGGQDGIVYYRDPMDGVIKTMSIAEFNRKGRADPFHARKNVYRLA